MMPMKTILKIILSILSLGFIAIMLIAAWIGTVDTINNVKGLFLKEESTEIKQKQDSIPISPVPRQQNQENYRSPAPSIIKTFNVRAKVYHFIGNAYDGYEKETNNSKTLEITVYSDGDVYCTSVSSGGFPLPVRYSRTNGYDYECNSGNTIYKFNTSELN